jgi:indole-3-glycerol phosphate synthase
VHRRRRITSPDDLRRVREGGADAAIVGEALMRAGDAAQARCRALIQSIGE